MFVNLWYGRKRKLQSISIGGNITPAVAADKE